MSCKTQSPDRKTGAASPLSPITPATTESKSIDRIESTITEPGAAGRYALEIGVRLELHGTAVACEVVEPADLVDVYAETWWRSCLRQGHPEVLPRDVQATMRPIFLDHRAPISLGFVFESTSPDGKLVSCKFRRNCLDHVADRIARRLMDDGALEQLDTYYYELRSLELDGTASAAGATDSIATPPSSVRPVAHPQATGAATEGFPVAMASYGTPVACKTLPLRRLLEQAESVGHGLHDPHHAVFYTRAALRMAERISRKGGREVPAVETGGVLVGPLCSCPETGEMFAVITDVLEATAAEQRTFSLTYSGATWARIQAVMNAKRKIPSRSADRILGQAHGHNFRPHGDAQTCEECEHVATCELTSAFLSSSDLTWCRSVFSGQPWQVSHIFGLNARGESDEVFYGLHEGRLRQRGYHVIPELDPTLFC